MKFTLIHLHFLSMYASYPPCFLFPFSCNLFSLYIHYTVTYLSFFILTLFSPLSLSSPPQVFQELEQSESDAAKKTTEVEDLQLRLDALSSKYNSDGKRQQQVITRLQQQLRERPVRRKVAVATGEGSSAMMSSAQSAPTAAVKPTVTTTPTASIRPMAIQTVTSTPRAHVTPTMVVQHVSAAVVTAVSSGATTNQMQAPVAAVFVRTTSPQVVTPIVNAVNAVASVTTTSSIPSTTTSVPPIITAAAMASSEPPPLSSSLPLVPHTVSMTTVSTTSVASTQVTMSTATSTPVASVVGAVSLSTLPLVTMVTSNMVSPTTTVGRGNLGDISSQGTSVVPPSSTGSVSDVVSSSATISRQPEEAERKKRSREREKDEPGR